MIYHRKANSKSDLEIGLIAQELQSTLSRFGQQSVGMVHQVADGFYAVRYNDLLAPMIKAMQELKEELIDLQKENRSLLRRLDQIE